MFRLILLISLTNIWGHAMRNDSELLTEGRLETNRDYLLDISSEFPIEDTIEDSERLPEPVKGLNLFSDSTASGIFFVNRTEQLSETIKGFSDVSESITSIFFDRGWLDLFEIEEIIRSEIRERIRSEFRQLPETRWVQNLRHPCYYLRQSIPILIKRAEYAVIASYEDVELHGTGNSVKEATSDLCTKIVTCYEELRESAAESQEYTFLKRIIEEVEPPAWQELKQLYKEKLEEIPYVQKGYIKIDGNDADVVIVLSEESVEIIEQLAEIDLEINLQFRPLYFFTEYESSEDYLELDDFECFY